MNFIIASPRQNSGGTIVLHKLCKLLTEHGYNAKIFYFTGCQEKIYKNKIAFWLYQFIFYLKDAVKMFIAKFFVNDENFTIRYQGYYYCPVKGCKRKYLPFFNKKRTIVVYPEIVYGNFLRAKHVVRWLLYYNRYAESKGAYGKNDLFIAFREIFNDEKLNSEKRLVNVHNFDSDLYRQTNFGERKGNCYIVRKGSKRADLPTQFDGVVIDTLSEFQKIKTFNQCEYCISYDMQTFYTTIASLCGCKVVCVPEPGKSRSDYLSSSEAGYGKAFSFEKSELEFAESTKNLMMQRINSFDQKNEENIKKFIDYCDSYFKNVVSTSVV